MNKKKIITTIIIDLISLAVIATAVCMMIFKDLNQWQKNLSTILIVIAIPVIFYTIFARYAFNKYENLMQEDNQLWEEVLGEDGGQQDEEQAQ